MVSAIKGYKGKGLYIDLSKRKVWSAPLSSTTYKSLIGGKGLGINLLLKLTKPNLDPLSPNAPLIFAVGPLNGTLVPGASKTAALFKSPLTGILGESYSGGDIASNIKYAGYDTITLIGKSEKPVYVIISDDGVDIKGADNLWGKNTFESEETIKRDHGFDFHVACIGPAGENLVRFACITHARGRQFGRCGAGAVMGSKNLKAVAIRGSESVDVARPEEVWHLFKNIMKRSKETLKSLTTYGTPAIMDLTQATGTLPTRYWTEGAFEGYDNINAEVLKEKLVRKSRACIACPVACSKISDIGSESHMEVVEGPDYETLFAFGPLCGIDDLQSVAKANVLCDKLGLDTITAGNVIAFGMACYERGILTNKACGGLDLTFGNRDALFQLITQIAFKEGLGALLAKGVARAAKLIGRGAESLAVHVKGLEPPAYDPRGLKGVGLAYAVSCRGACHLRHVAYRPNLIGRHPFKKEVTIHRLSYEGQAEMVKELEDFYALIDSMILCKFLCLPTIGPILWNDLTKIYSAVTGISVGIKDLILVGERINNLARLFNVREGVSRRDDTLPERFFEEPLPKGSSSGHVVDREAFESMLNKYYKLRGWSEEGFPTSNV